MKKNVFYNLIINRRTVRLFKPKEIPYALIKRVIGAARVAPSAANRQFLEYLVVKDKGLREKVFPHTRWAGYVYPARTPAPPARPAFYIIILINKNKSVKFNLRDVGAAAENILLSLVSFRLGGCWIISLNRRALRKILKIPSHYRIDSLIAAGAPAEFPKLETGEDIKYWLDRRGRLHVPKRPLKNILYCDKI